MGEQRLVGEIELFGRMAIGGMAEVWLGRESDRWVAVKRVLDLSPANVLLSWRGEVKLADFGIARRLGEPPGERLQGKPGYLSPEQALGLPMDARSDVFGLGILLYELLTGERLFSGTDLETSARQVCALDKIQFTRPLQVPVGIWALLRCMLETDPEDRPSSAEEVAEALGGAMGLLGVRRPPPNHESLAALFAKVFPRWVSPTARFASVEVDDVDVLEEQPVLTGRLLTLPPRRLGQILIGQGKLTGQELEWALHLTHSGKPLGQHLLDLGLIQSEDLERALLSQRFLPRTGENLQASGL